jgi:biotin synthase-like enzyme
MLKKIELAKTKARIATIKVIADIRIAMPRLVLRTTIGTMNPLRAAANDIIDICSET